MKYPNPQRAFVQAQIPKCPPCFGGVKLVAVDTGDEVSSFFMAFSAPFCRMSLRKSSSLLKLLVAIKWLMMYSALPRSKLFVVYRTVDRGSRYGHIFAGFLALVEIAVLLLVLNACQHGFQTMVICALGFIYSVIAFQGLTSNDFNVRRFATVVWETSRIRYLLNDRGFKLDEVEEDFLQLNKILAKNQVRTWIAGVKFCTIDLICLVGVVMGAL